MTSLTGWASPRGKWSLTPGSTVSGQARWARQSGTHSCDSHSKWITFIGPLLLITTLLGSLLRAAGSGLGTDLPHPLLRADRPWGAARVAASRVPRRHLPHLHHAALPARHPPRFLQVTADKKAQSLSLTTFTHRIKQIKFHGEEDSLLTTGLLKVCQ